MLSGGGQIEHKHYVMGPTGRIAVHTERSDLTRDTRWFHTDGLGSITVISDEAGRVLKRHTYDAWGKQATSYTNTGSGITNTSPSTRGFTDHEMLSDFGLIHMNGRVYDPVLGRFLSADPHVDGGEDAQGYNKYSYVGNNPMNATDPSGYFSLKDFIKIVAIVAVAVVGAMLGQVYLTGYIGQAFGAMGIGISKGVALGIAGGLGGGFASGFAGSLLNGGSIGDAFKAGLVGGLAGGITGGLLGAIGDAGRSGLIGNWFERGLAHGVVQGAAAEATGGEFRHGFYSGFAVGATEVKIGKWAKGSDSKGITAAAVVGGTASALGGGKFANGAVSGAFSYMFNALSEKFLSYRYARDSNALKFDEKSGTVLMVRSNTESGNLGGYWSDSDMSSRTNGRVRVLDVDLYSGTPEEIMKAAGFADTVFDHIVLERHNGRAGEGNEMMIRLFQPDSPLLQTLASHLRAGGDVWFNGCFGLQFFNSNPGYVSGLKATFGGATIYAAPGFQATFSYGLASQTRMKGAENRPIRYFDYKAY